MDAKTNFFEAVCRGDVDQVQQILQHQPELVDEVDSGNFGGPALNIAAFQGNEAMINTLLDAGADVERLSDWEPGPWSALQSAICTGNFGAAALLVRRGARLCPHGAAGLGDVDKLREMLSAQPELVHLRGGDGCTPLHFAKTIEVAQLLLEHDADINARDVDHYSTPAQYLARHCPEVATYLFQHGASVDIFTAAAIGDVPAVTLLIQEQPDCIHQRINQETFPPSNDFKEAHNILTFFVGMEATPLHAAARTNQGAIVRLLVDAGLQVDARGAYDNCTALHLAAWNDHAEAVERLLDAGADIDALSGDLHSNSPAGWAIVAGSSEAFRVLMERGAQRLDHFVGDAKQGVAGQFARFGNRDAIKQRQILDLLS